MAYNYTNSPFYPSLISAVNNVYDMNSLNVPYNTISLNANDCNQITGFTGNIATNGIIGTLTNGTANAAVAFVQSAPIKFMGGELTRARFGVVFTAGAGNTTQFAGLTDQNNGLAFGYQGNTFGIITRSGGVSDLRQLAITGNATTAGNVVVTLDGNPVNVPVLAGDTIRTVTKKIQSQKADTWNSIDGGNVVLFSSYLSGPRVNTFSYSAGTTGAAGTLSQVNVGNVGTTGFIPQTTWAIDPANDTQSLPVLNPTIPQVYGISFQNSGFGAATFYIQSARDARFYPVHRLTLSGNTASAQPLLNTETLPMRVQTQNLGPGGANMPVTSMNMQVDVYNPSPLDQLTGPRYTVATAVSNYTVRKNLVNHMMTLQNPYNLNPGINYADVQLVGISASYDGIGTLQLFLYKNANTGDPSVVTPGATVNFTQVAPPTVPNALTNSYIAASSNVTGGILQKYYGIVKGTNIIDNVQQQFIVMSPGDTLTFAVSLVDAINGPGSDITISVVFCEKT